MQDFKIVGSRLGDKRRERGLTQECVADSADITATYLSKIENGKAVPSWELLHDICDVLDMNMSEAISGTETSDDDYGHALLLQYFNACRPDIKQVALELLEKLSRIK